MKNNICISCSQDIERPIWLDKVSDFIDCVLCETGIDNWEVSVTFCSNDFIQDLNAKYRNVDAPTDVLSFENGSSYFDEKNNEIFCAGDIIISISALMRNVEVFNVSADEELKRLLIHGLLHLDGQDHGDFHIEKDGKILGPEEKVPVYKDLSEKNKKECDMLIMQEELLYKFFDKTIIDK
ncbi:MAG: rRNA maturation RNase YbeY [Treponemataceae bacterium]